MKGQDMKLYYISYTIESGILNAVKDKVKAGFILEPLLQLLCMRN